jgi:hypothetical protein
MLTGLEDSSAGDMLGAIRHITGTSVMRFLKKLIPLVSLVIPTLVVADAGISISYRSTPVIIHKNWLDASNWPEEAAVYRGIVTERSLNMVTANFYFDDTLRGHDKVKSGNLVTRHFILKHEPPSKDYPAGRMVEREIDIGDATSAQINARNGKTPGQEGYVYEEQVYVDEKVLGFLPGWLNPNRGAGYIMGVSFNYAAEAELVEYYSWDAYIGKRLFLLPHLAHIYFKIGPSYARYNYDFVDRYLATENKIGLFYNIGVQVQVLKGIKFFSEAEFRGYSPATLGDSFNLENSSLEFVNTLPPFSENYKDTKFGKKWLRDLITQGIRFGLKFSF